MTRSREGTLSVSNNKQTKQANHQLSFPSKLVGSISLHSPLSKIPSTKSAITHMPRNSIFFVILPLAFFSRRQPKLSHIKSSFRVSGLILPSNCFIGVRFSFSNSSKKKQKKNSFPGHLISLLSLLLFFLPSRNAATYLHSTCKCNTSSLLLFTLV